MARSAFCDHLEVGVAVATSLADRLLVKKATFYTISAALLATVLAHNDILEVPL